MARRQPKPVLTWEQMQAFPPALVTAELTVHYDGPAGTMQTAWRLRETDTDAVIGMEVQAVAAGILDGLRVTRAARLLHERAVSRLGPF